MTIRTVEQYLDSLKDARVVYYDGKKVTDITKHPVLRGGIARCATVYTLPHDPRYKDLLVAKLDNGEPVFFGFLPAKSSSDLLRRRDIVMLFARTCLGLGAGARFTGLDVLNALTVVSRRMDKKEKTNYSERVENYRRYLLQNDSAIVAAVTDVKGDRSLRPSQQKPHKDFYVHIVDEQKDGIVVRGAKFHISATCYANEIFACPTRTMREDDKDYAVAFAIPVNTPGISLVMGAREPVDEGNVDEFPLSAYHYTAEALVVFDDVFIPMDRVFLKKEWQYSGQIAHAFGDFHRLFADTYKYAELEILTGAGALMAEYNGIDKASHVLDKLSWLAFYTETVGALGQTACKECLIEPDTGLAYPNPVFSNAAKFFYAENYHQAIKYVQDISGGIIADLPSFKNYLSEETRPFIEKYFRGKAEIPTEHRLRATLLARDACTAFWQATTIHAEGSLAAQRMAIYGSADWPRYKALARKAAHISDGSEHPLTKELPPFPPELNL